MAKIKIKMGPNEIELDSRDFYLDNQTAGQVIENLSKHLGTGTKAADAAKPEPSHGGLDTLEDAEAFEPEFDEPRAIEPAEIPQKLRDLEADGFFASPRMVGETVARLRESGWLASQLDVSKALAQMASHKEISRNSEDDRTYYFAAAQHLA